MTNHESQQDWRKTMHQYLMDEYANWIRQGHTTLSFEGWLDWMKSISDEAEKKDRPVASPGDIAPSQGAMGQSGERMVE